MARTSTLVRIASVGALLLVVLTLLGGVARAQNLPRLNVERFSMTARPASPTFGKTFHLRILVQMKGRVRRLDTVTLPILSELEVRGDERSITYAGGVSTYLETLTVRAHTTGKIALAPATLDAIDAKSGAAEQYSSNALVILVRGGAMQPFGNARSAVGNALAILLRIAFWGFAALALLLVTAIVLIRRGRTPSVAVESPVLTVPVVEPTATRREQLLDALLVLQAEPTRACAMRVRLHVRGMIGASPRETLADVIARLKTDDRPLSGLLTDLERAAFTTDDDIAAAIRASCAALAQLLGGCRG